MLGTGEATLAELSDGSILYNSREHMSRGNRYFAWSHDGGNLWNSPTSEPRSAGRRCKELPTAAWAVCSACLWAGRDVLLYSNLDTPAGEMPARDRRVDQQGPDKITVWASFDGARTWPVKRWRLWSQRHSNLGVGRTDSEPRQNLTMLRSVKVCFMAMPSYRLFVGLRFCG